MSHKLGRVLFTILHRHIFLFVLISCYLMPSSVWGQQPENFSSRIGVDEKNPLSLSLSDAIRRTLESNSEIEVERINVQQADINLAKVKGVYDPNLALGTFFTRQSVPITSILGGSVTGTLDLRELASKAELGGLLSSGGNYSFQASYSRSGNSSFYEMLDPQITTRLSITFRQPLLRNRKIDDPRRQIIIAQHNLDLSDSQFRQRVIEIIAQLEHAYWDLYFAIRSVDIAKESVALAQAQKELTKSRIEAGLDAIYDIDQVEAKFQLRQEEVEAAIEQVAFKENTLKSLMLSSRTALEWNQPIIPSDTPKIDSYNFDLDGLVKDALANRQEIKQLEVRQDLAKANTSYFNNQLKPQVDFIASYETLGLAGRFLLRNSPIPLPPNSTLPGFLRGGIGQSLVNLFENRGYTVQVGFQINFPLNNRVAINQLASSKMDEKKLSIQQNQVQIQIEKEVRNALQSLKTAQKRMTATQAERVAAERQLLGEQTRFNADLSTNFLVLTRQQELSDARGRELKALTDYKNALVELQRAIGATLNLHNVEVQPPRN